MGGAVSHQGPVHPSTHGGSEFQRGTERTLGGDVGGGAGTGAGAGNANQRKGLSNRGLSTNHLNRYRSERRQSLSSLTAGSVSTVKRQLFGKKPIRGRILVLGLDGSGKTTLVHELVKLGEDEETMYLSSISGSTLHLPVATLNAFHQKSGNFHGSNFVPHPTKAIKISSCPIDHDLFLQMIDVPGRKDFRSKWYLPILHDHNSNAASLNSLVPISSASMGMVHTAPVMGVIYVIDAADHLRFPNVAQELVRLQKLKLQKPQVFSKAHLFVVLNKTDLCMEEITTQDRYAKQQKMKDLRKELKKCYEHAIKMAQVDTFMSSNAFSSSSKNQTSEEGGGGQSSRLNTAMLASMFECNSRNRESVKAVKTWIKDELKRIS